MSRGLGHIERTILQMVKRTRRTKQRVHFDALDIVLEPTRRRASGDALVRPQASP
jgi:hypothetical protein